ncbi:hypothetical protein CJ030_MR1G027786 [Morella rubra]|uniref:Uncharacterized protein n=1 Tax=Morella rubra TaxID=262757 RepID=A0A6A1WLK3_9ROSI|nr:hypothetical protein CJ030_MR1G027786 [Morella rubra]
MERKDAAKIKGIVVCAIISAATGPKILGNSITVKGFKTVHRPIGVGRRGSDHVWLEYFELQPSKRYWDRKDEGEACDLQFSTLTFYIKSSLIHEKVGAYLVTKNEERIEYHPRMRHDPGHVHGEDIEDMEDIEDIENIENRGGKRLCITKFNSEQTIQNTSIK